MDMDSNFKQKAYNKKIIMCSRFSNLKCRKLTCSRPNNYKTPENCKIEWILIKKEKRSIRKYYLKSKWQKRH